MQYKRLFKYDPQCWMPSVEGHVICGHTDFVTSFLYFDGNLHGLPDPAWLRLRCHAALNPVFIHPQGCDRIPKINYHHELSKARCRKRSGLLHIRMEVRTWNRIGSSNAETSIL